MYQESGFFHGPVEGPVDGPAGELLGAGPPLRLTPELLARPLLPHGRQPVGQVLGAEGADLHGPERLVELPEDVGVHPQLTGGGVAVLDAVAEVEEVGVGDCPDRVPVPLDLDLPGRDLGVVPLLRPLLGLLLRVLYEEDGFAAECGVPALLRLVVARPLRQARHGVPLADSVPILFQWIGW